VKLLIATETCKFDLHITAFRWCCTAMMLDVPLLKWLWLIFAAWCMLGTGPVYFALWFIWKCISLAFPRWVYESGDDFLYSLYQKMVLFFCQNCSGVEVGELLNKSVVIWQQNNVQCR